MPEHCAHSIDKHEHKVSKQDNEAPLSHISVYKRAMNHWKMMPSTAHSPIDTQRHT